MLKLRYDEKNNIERFINKLIENIDNLCQNEDDKFVLLEILKNQSYLVNWEIKKDLFDVYFSLENIKKVINDETVEVFLGLVDDKFINRLICEKVEIYKTDLIKTLLKDKIPWSIIYNWNKKYIYTVNNEFVGVTNQNHKMNWKMYLCEDNNWSDLLVDTQWNIILTTTCIEQNMSFLDEYIQISCTNEVHFLNENLKTVFPGVSWSNFKIHEFNWQTCLASWDYEELEKPNYFKSHKVINYKLYDLDWNMVFSSNDILDVLNIIKFNNWNRFVIWNDNNYNKFIYDMDWKKISESMHICEEIVEFENPFDQEKYFLISNFSNGYLFSSDWKFKTITTRLLGKNFGEEVFFDKNWNMYFELNSITDTGTIIDVNWKKKSMFTKLLKSIKINKLY